jgi:hypothetical protein
MDESNHQPQIPPAPRDDPADLLSTPPATDGITERIEHRPRVGRSSLTLVLGTVVVLGLGFLGGILVQRQLGSPAAASPGTGNFTFPRTGASAGPGGFNGSGGFAAGTVSKVQGNTVYITTTDGRTIKVVTTGSTQIRVTKTGTLGDLTPGTDVVVQGTPQGSGSTIEANTISEGGGFRGGFPGGAPQPGSSP